LFHGLKIAAQSAHNDHQATPRLGLTGNPCHRSRDRVPGY
jgi:hypothetical protein